MAFQAWRISQEKRRAQAQAIASERVTEFMAGMFGTMAPRGALGRDATGMEVLEHGASRAQAGFEQQPEIRARLLAVIGDVYLRLGMYDEGIPLMHESTRLYEELSALHDAYQVAAANLASAYYHQGELDAAEQQYKSVLRIIDPEGRSDDPFAVSLTTCLAAVYSRQERLDEAEDLLLRALTIMDDGGDGDPHLAWTLASLADVQRRQQRYEEAERNLLRALSILDRDEHVDNPDLALVLERSAELYHVWGRYDDAEPFYRRSLEVWERSLEPDHPESFDSLAGYAALLRDLGRDAEAAELEARVEAAKAGGPESSAGR
jgi:tetratricopeptide (TPR) repeat protein